MTTVELKQKMSAVFSAGNEVSKALSDLAGNDSQGLVGVHLFVANQHLQDCMNRVSNLGALLAQLTDESVAQTVDNAAAAGNIRVMSDVIKGE